MMDPVQSAVTASIDKLKSQARESVFRLDDEQRRFLPDVVVAYGGMQAKAEAMATCEAAVIFALDQAQKAVEKGDKAEAARQLTQAQALVAAQAAEIEMVAAAASDGGGPGGPPPPGLQKLINKLGAFGRWLWSVVQTLLTPKEWSIEGGVSAFGLTEAKISVTFGG